MIESYGIPWCYREDSPLLALKGRAFIINLASRGSPGTHWTAARLLFGTLYYADPFGTILNGWPPEELRRVASSEVVNRIAFQRPSSNFCGYYSIAFALAMDCIDKPLTREEFEQLLYNAVTID